MRCTVDTVHTVHTIFNSFPLSDTVSHHLKSCWLRVDFVIYFSTSAEANEGGKFSSESVSPNTCRRTSAVSADVSHITESSLRFFECVLRFCRVCPYCVTVIPIIAIIKWQRSMLTKVPPPQVSVSEIRLRHAPAEMDGSVRPHVTVMITVLYWDCLIDSGQTQRGERGMPACTCALHGGSRELGSWVLWRKRCDSRQNLLLTHRVLTFTGAIMAKHLNPTHPTWCALVTLTARQLCQVFPSSWTEKLWRGETRSSDLINSPRVYIRIFISKSGKRIWVDQAT